MNKTLLKKSQAASNNNLIQIKKDRITNGKEMI